MDLSFLDSSPNNQQIHDITSSIIEQQQNHNIDNITSLQIINTYLEKIIPSFESLSKSNKSLVSRLFQSSIGISNLVNYYKLTKNVIYFVFFKHLILDINLLRNILVKCEGRKLELQQVKSLFFGSKIYQIFAKEIDINDYLDLLSKQLINLMKFEKADEFIQPFLSLHPVESKYYLFNSCLTSLNYEKFVNNFRRLKNKRIVLLKYLLPYIDNFIEVTNINNWANVLNDIEIMDAVDDIVLEVAKFKNLYLQILVTMLVRNPKQEFLKLVKIWSNNNFIEDMQEYYTNELLVLLRYILDDGKHEISKDKAFLDAITQRLQLNNSEFRDYTMMVAKNVATGIDYEIDNEINIPDVKFVKRAVDFSELSARKTDKLFISNQKATENTIIKKQVADSDDEEDFDTEQPATPVFLKDLIAQFNDSKITSVTELLKISIQLVRQKATFKLEIEYYSEELISIIAGLTNKFNEKDFEQLKINALVSIIVVNPNIITFLITLLFTGDYSLQQRMMILSSISLSARELSGKDDDFIAKPQFDFPTSQIESRKLIQEVVPESPQVPKIEEIGNGTVLRRSKKLDNANPKRKPNNFSKIAPKFFYPLLHGYQNGAQLGSHNELFVSHYKQTLQLVLHSSYPCHEFNDMLQQLNDLDIGGLSI